MALLFSSRELARNNAVALQRLLRSSARSATRGLHHEVAWLSGTQRRGRGAVPLLAPSRKPVRALLHERLARPDVDVYPRVAEAVIEARVTEQQVAVIVA